MRSLLFILSLLSASPLAAQAAPTEEQYLAADDYIITALEQAPGTVTPEILWITNDIRPAVIKILGRSNFPLRYRYWRKDQRTVWILEEIGKVLPITTGITVEDGKIVDLTVLTYRESHGSEIRFPAYRSQFNGVELSNALRLSKPINGISGATLSTNAMKRISRLALYLHRQVMNENDPSAQQQ